MLILANFITNRALLTGVTGDGDGDGAAERDGGSAIERQNHY